MLGIVYFKFSLTGVVPIYLLLFFLIIQVVPKMIRKMNILKWMILTGTFLPSIRGNKSLIWDNQPAHLVHWDWPMKLNAYLKKKDSLQNKMFCSFGIQKKRVYNQLYPVALTVFSVATTEVSVEQLFSNVNFILHPLRTNISTYNLQRILFIRSNFEAVKSFLLKIN